MSVNDSAKGLSKRALENVSKPDHWAPLIKSLSNPWSETNTDGTIILGIAENTLMHKEIADHITRNFAIDPQSQLTYGNGPQGSPRLRSGLAGFFNERFHPITETTAEEFVITAGVTAMIDHLTWCICNEGEGILFPQPLYTGFTNDVPTRSRGRVVPVSFEREDGSLELADVFDAAANSRCLERALRQAETDGVKVKAVMITNPHNPLGKCYPPETIEAIAAFCAKHKLHYLSDEIYALSTFENTAYPKVTPFYSVLSLQLDGIIDPSFFHVLYGPAKDFCANGLRLGAFYTRNSMLRQAMISVTTFAWQSYLTQDTWARILEDAAFLAWYIAENQRRLAEHYRILTDFLDEQSIPYFRGGNAGIFLWVDLRRHLDSGTRSDGSAANSLRAAKEVQLSDAWLLKGVMIARGGKFLSEELGWFRITFTAEKPALREGLRRFVEVLDED
ncbi:hypothetical protein LTR36_005895 [Oleoguttula mirabilis]|uniref:Aminotransferase class I/classII large domain-containing protein n=1 Tax=Oleoguttula mirabilis TaxID=1507867 RepID=A0AAV9JD76_9PEZI|nr:hypothetical protein LTR36_005895 [Oleoguttula mirabilis]